MGAPYERDGEGEMGRPLEGVVLAKVLGLALRDRMARPGRARVPEPMVMDDPEGVRVFHESAMDVQLPVYEFNASSMSRLVPEGGSVLDLGSGSGQLAVHLVTGRPDVTVRCVDLSRPWWTPDDARRLSGGWTALGSSSGTSPRSTRRSSARRTSSAARGCFTSFRTGRPLWRHSGRSRRSASSTAARCGSTTWPGFGARRPCLPCSTCSTRAPTRLRVDGLASEAAAWTVEELTESLAEAGLTGLTWCRDRLLGLHHAWWASGRGGHSTPAEWTSPPMSPAARRTADRLAQGMTGAP